MPSRQRTVERSLRRIQHPRHPHQAPHSSARPPQRNSAGSHARTNRALPGRNHQSSATLLPSETAGSRGTESRVALPAAVHFTRPTNSWFRSSSGIGQQGPLEPQAMILKYIGWAVFLLAVCLLPVWFQRQSRMRHKRVVAIARAIADKGRSEINGQPAEYWLSILNEDATWPIRAYDAMVLTYKGVDFFFVDGAIVSWAGPGLATGWRCHCENSCFLVAVGQAAVRLLLEQSQVFGLVAGSMELAVFSILRPSNFTEIMMAGRRRLIEMN